MSESGPDGDGQKIFLRDDASFPRGNRSYW